jgi:hypothetical protein
MFYEGLYLYQKTGVNTARTLYVPQLFKHTYYIFAIKWPAPLHNVNVILFLVAILAKHCLFFNK